MLGKSDPSGRWLWTAVAALALMLLILYVGQGWPSLIYVVLVLGLLAVSMLALIVHHLYDLLWVGKRIAELSRASRQNALIFLVVAGIVIATKLLGWW